MNCATTLHEKPKNTWRKDDASRGAPPIKFYREGLGFELVSSDGKPVPHFDWALLRLNGTELMLNTAYDEDQRPPTPDPARIRAHQDTVIYFGCADVDGAYAHLRGTGINVREPKGTSYGMKQLYLPDPDGYLLCFQWRAEAGECSLTSRSPGTAPHSHR